MGSSTIVKKVSRGFCCLSLWVSVTVCFHGRICRWCPAAVSVTTECWRRGFQGLSSLWVINCKSLRKNCWCPAEVFEGLLSLWVSVTKFHRSDADTQHGSVYHWVLQMAPDVGTWVTSCVGREGVMKVWVTFVNCWRSFAEGKETAEELQVWMFFARSGSGCILKRGVHTSERKKAV